MLDFLTPFHSRVFTRKCFLETAANHCNVVATRRLKQHYIAMVFFYMGGIMKVARAALIALVLWAQSVSATTFQTDASDIWWNASESGWGVNVIHQDNILFMTFFVYGQDGKAVWYVAPNTVWTPAGPYTGPLYRTTGPWLGTVFNPSAVGVTQVGTATFTFRYVEEATLSYSVDGVTVNKTIRRQTWRDNNLGGNYTGALRQTQSGCGSLAVPGTYISPATISIAHTGLNNLPNQPASISITMTTSADRCVFSGYYKQEGRMGYTYGAYSCTRGSRGDYTIFALEGTESGISGRFTSTGNICSDVTGRFGAVRN